MKSKYIVITLAVMSLLAGCQNSNIPDDAVLVPPVSGLIVNVSGEDYTGVPTLGVDGAFTNTYSLPVKIPNKFGTIVQLDFTEPGCTADIAVGDKIEFDENNAVWFSVFRNGTLVGRYEIKMDFNPPPFMYFIKTSDRDDIGNRYYLNHDNPQIIASGTYDEWFEGQVDLTMSNWDNIGLVSDDLSTIYNVATGPWPPLSDYTWTAETKESPNTGCYPTEGPWNDWRATNDNPDIISPGVWYLIFNAKTMSVSMTMTQWCVSGSAVGAIKAMTYDSDTRLWTITLTLTSGKLRFVTIPVSFGDMTFNLGLSEGISKLSQNGADIDVTEAGNYVVTLDLSNPPYYDFSIVKN